MEQLLYTTVELCHRNVAFGENAAIGSPEVRTAFMIPKSIYGYRLDFTIFSA
jgi:hypothetical protein